MTMRANPKILFILQRPEAWINFESVWRALSETKKFDLTLLLLPYNFSDKNTSDKMAPVLRAKIQECGIPYIEWTKDFKIKKDQFDIAVFGHPYDLERPKEFWFDNLSKLVKKTVYIPYGIFMGGGRKFTRLQFAQPTQIKATAVIARSESEKLQYALHCPSGNKHVHVMGYPRFDAFPIYPSGLNLKKEKKISSKKILVWNSHFSFGLDHSQISNFSTFDLIGPELFQAIRERKEKILLIWRPHPGLFPAMKKHGIFSEKNEKSLENELNSIGVFLDKNPDHTKSFLISDALATDVSSFFLEYLATQKPIVALINPDGQPLNDEANELISNYYTASNPSQLINFIDLLLDEKCSPPRKSIQKKHIPFFDGNSGVRVARLISEMAELNDPELFKEKNNVLIDEAIEFNFDEIDGNLETPILDDLCQNLIRLRNAKKNESAIRKRIRAIMRESRLELTEIIKRSPRLLAIKDFFGNK